MNWNRTWRAPARELNLEASPVPWMTTNVRLAIQEALTPIIRGARPLRGEMEARFFRAHTFCTTLGAAYARGDEPTAETVAELVRAGV